MSIKRVGVIGGGQLAWMMGEPARALGVELIVQTPHETDSAVAIASDTILASIDDASATAALASRCDVITFENEFINLEALRQLETQGVCFRPNLDALAPLLDKYHQRCYLRDIGLPVPQFTALGEQASKRASEQSSKRAGEHFHSLPKMPDFPLVVKARRLGYDGQGTFIIKDADAWESALKLLGGAPAIVEEYIPFERELAVIAARSVSGEIVVYPVVETQQENQVCRRVLAGTEISSSIKQEVEAHAHTLLESLQAVGVFGIELFLTASGKVLVNEVSPRTHNSGHYTIDACLTSQFEQHLRAVCGLPLGGVECPKPSVMVNLLGYEHSQTDYRQKREAIAQIPHAHLYWYGKTASRPGRKLGHVTILLDADNATAARSQLLTLAEQVESIWYGYLQ